LRNRLHLSFIRLRLRFMSGVRLWSLRLDDLRISFRVASRVVPPVQTPSWHHLVAVAVWSVSFVGGGGRRLGGRPDFTSFLNAALSMGVIVLVGGGHSWGADDGAV
jgi:hypothetical protein